MSPAGLPRFLTFMTDWRGFVASHLVTFQDIPSCLCFFPGEITMSFAGNSGTCVDSAWQCSLWIFLSTRLWDRCGWEMEALLGRNTSKGEPLLLMLRWVFSSCSLEVLHSAATRSCSKVLMMTPHLLALGEIWCFRWRPGPVDLPWPSVTFLRFTRPQANCTLCGIVLIADGLPADAVLLGLSVLFVLTG